MTKVICGLHMLKILSVIERQTSFQIGSLRCVKYVKKKPNLTILIGLKSKKNLSTMVANIPTLFHKNF